MLCQSLLCSKVIQKLIPTYYLYPSSIMVYHRPLNSFLCYTVDLLLVIHPIYNGLHLLTPNSSGLFPTHIPLGITSLFSMSLFQINIAFSRTVNLSAENYKITRCPDARTLAEQLGAGSLDPPLPFFQERSP